MTTTGEIWGPDDGPAAPEGPPMAVYCPSCSAYLLTLGFEPEECEVCGYLWPTTSQACEGDEG